MAADVRATPWFEAKALTRETTHLRLMRRADRFGWEERHQLLQRDGSILSKPWRRAPPQFPAFMGFTKVEGEDAQ